MELKNSIIITTRFSDTDAMKIVWHGNYLRYFEDGREAFGREFGLRYMDMYTNGFAAPVVDLQIQYKKPVSFNHDIRVETVFKNTPAAKLKFHYTIFDNASGELLCTGSSIQVFVDLDGNLQLTHPDFFREWKLRHSLL